MSKWELLLMAFLIIVLPSSIAWIIYNKDYSCGPMYNLQSNEEYELLPSEVIRDMDIG